MQKQASPGRPIKIKVKTAPPVAARPTRRSTEPMLQQVPAAVAAAFGGEPDGAGEAGEAGEAVEDLQPASVRIIEHARAVRRRASLPSRDFSDDFLNMSPSEVTVVEHMFNFPESKWLDGRLERVSNTASPSGNTPSPSVRAGWGGAPGTPAAPRAPRVPWGSTHATAPARPPDPPLHAWAPAAPPHPRVLRRRPARVRRAALGP